MDQAIQNIYDDLTTQLRVVVQGERDEILIAKSSIQSATNALLKLRTHIFANPFESPEDEILFFKSTKPRFHSLLVYWIDVFDIEINKPVGGREIEEKYLRGHLQKLKLHFNSHAGFYKYYRSGETGLDSTYFLRANKQTDFQNPRSIDSDPNFSTSHDFLVTRLLADKMLEERLNDLAFKSDNPTAGKTTHAIPVLFWTASKAGLVELIYSFQSTGVFNNGRVGIRDIALEFEKLFGVELGNYYQVFNEIRLRKKGRAQLLEQLKKGLELKMDELDER